MHAKAIVAVLVSIFAATGCASEVQSEEIGQDEGEANTTATKYAECNKFDRRSADYRACIKRIAGAGGTPSGCVSSYHDDGTTGFCDSIPGKKCSNIANCKAECQVCR
jgi:hypothetical protein